MALAAPVSACSYWAPDITTVSYSPGDGLNAELPDVWVRNLLVVGQAADGTGVLTGVFFNQTDTEVEIVVTSDEGGLDATLTIPPQGRLQLTAPGPEGGEAADLAGADIPRVAEVVLVDPVGVPPGQTIAIAITTPAYGEVVLEPPVTLPTSEYEGFLDQVPNAQGSGPPLEELVNLQGGADTGKPGK